MNNATIYMPNFVYIHAATKYNVYIACIVNKNGTKDDW